MNARDWDYIETRLLGGFPQTEAVPRLRFVGYPDLAERLMEAAKVFQGECRAVRNELQERGEYRGGKR